MEILWILLGLLFVLLGLAVGSFLNVCIDRLPRNESIVNPPSHCEDCQHKLAVKDLIPVFSYLRLRGRCRYCQASIPRRVFWVELATPLIFALICWTPYVQLGFPLIYESIVYFYMNLILAFYACLFIIIFVIDLEHGLILNKVVYPGMVVALLLALLHRPWFTGLILGSGVANAALGGAIGFALFLLIAIVSRGGMGWGDVKLAALIGLATGFPLVFVAIIMGAILGGIAAVALMIAKRRTRRETIPFGPFLAVAAMVTMLWGNSILDWYFSIMNWHPISI
jgi:leader peptidase (prepilin peptidase)/N-methyltransferase